MMARKKQAGDPPSMSSIVKVIMTENPGIKAPDIVDLAKSNYGVDIPPKTAAVYRYNNLNPKKTKKRKKGKLKVAATPVAPTVRLGSSMEGFDDLFRAAEKLGWKRLKDVVQKITQAPH
jgi:hypothetical protein